MKQDQTAIDIFKEQLKECGKICLSFLYFVNTFVWIEDKERKIAIPFKLWPSQIRIIPEFLSAMRLIILKARQLGLTWLTAAYCLWLAITRPLQLIVVISAKEDWAVEFLDRVKFILDRLPDWMYPKISKRTSEILEFEHRDHLFSTIKSLPTTPEGAESKTCTLLVLDETCRNRYIKEIWAASKPGIDAAKGRIILISNSIKTGVGWGWTRDIFTNSIKKLNDFVNIFMPWWDHPERPKDFLEQQKLQGMDEEDISEHYPSTAEEAISAMLGSYFRDTLARFKPYKGVRGHFSFVKEPDAQIREKKGSYQFTLDRNGILEMWGHPELDEEGRPINNWDFRYAIGSDVSEGLGESYSVAYVYDRKEKKFVARMRSNRVETAIWADRLIELAEYYLNASLGIERNGPGISTIQYLQGKYYNLFYRQIPTKVKGQYAKEYGWHTDRRGDSGTKHILAGDLKRHYRAIFTKVPCAILLDESSTFIRHEGGKIEGELGKLDDCVMAAGITIQVSQSLPEPVNTSPIYKTSLDKRIEWLEKRKDDYEIHASMEQEQALRHLGVSAVDYGEDEDFQGTELVPTTGL